MIAIFLLVLFQNEKCLDMEKHAVYNMNNYSGICLHICFFVKERWSFMLVLTRKVGEEFVIDGNILVKIIKISGKKVRIGIQAPEKIPVHRGEIKNPRKAFSYAYSLQTVG